MYRRLLNRHCFSSLPPSQTSTTELHLLKLLSQTGSDPGSIFSLYSSISGPLVSSTTTLSVLRLALQTQQYSISKDIITTALPSLCALLSTTDYEHLMVEADKNNDHLGQQKIFEAVESSPNCQPTTTMLNSLLSGGLTYHSNNKNKAPNHAVDDWIIRILQLFRTNSLIPNHFTIEIIFTHCILAGDWRTVVALLNPSLNLLHHLSQSSEFVHFLLYELGAAGLSKLVATVWKLFSTSNDSLLHLAALDALVSSSNPTVAKDAMEVYNALLAVVSSSSGNSPVHDSTLVAFGGRLSTLLLKGAHFDLLLSLLITMRRHSMPVESFLFFRIFDGILLQAASPKEGFEHLGAFIAALVQELGPASLSPDLRAALIKITSRHHVPSSFMDHLERLERSSLENTTNQ